MQAASILVGMLRPIALAVLLLALATSTASQNVTSPPFHWLDSGKDAALFQRIKLGFAEELKPDDPVKVKPYVPQEYKWISRIGVFESSALVLIGERSTRTFTYSDYFVAFNYDLKSGEKTSLTEFNEGFTRWKFKKLVRFDSSRAPDVVFTSPSCTECEAEYLLGSFRFDSADSRWKVRTWGEQTTDILIGRDYSVGTEDDSKDDCLFSFADFNGDGFDDLAVRCLTISEEGKILEDTTTLYTVQQGKSNVPKIADRQELATIRDKLCVNATKSKLSPK